MAIHAIHRIVLEQGMALFGKKVKPNKWTDELHLIRTVLNRDYNKPNMLYMFNMLLYNINQQNNLFLSPINCHKWLSFC